MDNNIIKSKEYEKPSLSIVCLSNKMNNVLYISGGQNYDFDLNDCDNISNDNFAD